MTLPVFKSPQYAVIQFDGILPVFGADDYKCENDNIESFKIKLISGISFMENQVLEVDFASEVYGDLSINSIIDSQGEWAAIAESSEQNKFAILADAYGYCPVFYSIVDNCGVFVSDSFQGVMSGLRDFEVERHLNTTNYTTLLAGQGPQFQNSFSHATMALEVRILPVEELLLVSQTCIQFVSRSNFGAAAFETSYENALRRGVESSSVVVNALNDLEDHSKRVTLSGGVDSRLTFGILAASSANINFDVHSIDPRNWGTPGTRDVIERDIKISNEIRSAYDLSWWKPGKRDALSLDFRESLALHQSYRSNFSFLFAPSSMHVMFQRPLITLRGGGGELIRSTDGGVSMSKALRGDPDSDIHDVGHWLARKYLGTALLTSEYRERAYASVSDSFVSTTGETFEERMNSFYFNYRNRAHFGHTRHTASTNETALHLLSNPYFLQASKLIPFESRASGQMVKDIFSETSSGLRNYPFENKHWSDVLSTVRYDSYDWSNDSWKDSVANRSGIPLAFRPGWDRGQRGEKYRFDRSQASINYIVEGFSVLEDLISPDERSSIREQHLMILENVRKKKVNPFHLVAKVASALDVFFVPTSGTRRLFSLTPSRGIISSRARIVPTIPSFPNDGINNASIFEQRPTIIMNDLGFLVRSNPVLNGDQDYVYAFYLYKDGKKIDQVWYQKYSSTTFSLERRPGVYHAIAFARYVGRSSPTFQEPTSKVSVPDQK